MGDGEGVGEGATADEDVDDGEEDGEGDKDEVGEDSEGVADDKGKEEGKEVSDGLEVSVREDKVVDDKDREGEEEVSDGVEVATREDEVADDKDRKEEEEEKVSNGIEVVVREGEAVNVGLGEGVEAVEMKAVGLKLDVSLDETVGMLKITSELCLSVIELKLMMGVLDTGMTLQRKPWRPKSTHTSPASHGSGMQGSRTISQTIPSMSRGQIHSNPPMSCGMHVPPFRHGFGSQGSSSVQFCPAYPCTQLHVYVLLPSSQEIVLF